MLGNERRARLVGDFFGTIERFGDAPALFEGGCTVGYAELARRADGVAARLGGGRQLVFLECRNTVASIAAYLGCLRAGHVVALFADQSEERLARLIDRYRPDAVIHATEDAELTIERRGGSSPHVLHPDLCVLLSTSGSTGSPKFVKLSVRNVAANAAAIAEYLDLTGADRAVTSLKFNYSYGMSVVNSHLAVGGALVLTDHSVVEPAFWQAFDAAGATSFAGVPYSFELLARSDDWAARPSLRYVTQAGGRLPPDEVRRLSELGRAHGWNFFVMYGQTEAAPRMAYLPPALASEHPECIGVAVPGGTLDLIGEDGATIDRAEAAGELVYAGPNVMMGYAEAPADLATDATPPLLRTGDIAVRTAAGLFRIVGRTSRFVKPFGVRLNLDELQATVRATLPGAVCTGTDERVVIAVPATTAVSPSDAGAIARAHALPAFAVEIVAFNEVPMLPSGKPDYQRILARHPAGRPPLARDWGHKLTRTVQMAGSGAFYRRAAVELKTILGLAKPDWQDVRAIFALLAGARAADGRDTFVALAGDSLSYVQTSLALEAYLGFLPDDWDTLSVDDLEAMRSNEAVV